MTTELAIKVDVATGAVLERLTRRTDAPRALGKEQVVLPLDVQATPEIDPFTQELVRAYVLPDLENLTLESRATETRTATDRPLADCKMLAAVEVNRQAGVERERYATASPLQDSVYRQKQQEAAAFAADGTIGALLAARAARLDVTAATVAAEWSARATLWITAAAAIEDVREAALEAISAATDAAGVRAALAATDWPAPPS